NKNRATEDRIDITNIEAFLFVAKMADPQLARLATVDGTKSILQSVANAIKGLRDFNQNLAPEDQLQLSKQQLFFLISGLPDEAIKRFGTPEGVAQVFAAFGQM